MNAARKAILEDVFVRAGTRRVFGYDSANGRPFELVNRGASKVEDGRRASAKDIDRVCVEGEKGRPWQCLPAE